MCLTNTDCVYAVCWSTVAVAHRILPVLRFELPSSLSPSHSCTIPSSSLSIPHTLPFYVFIVFAHLLRTRAEFIRISDYKSILFDSISITRNNVKFWHMFYYKRYFDPIIISTQCRASALRFSSTSVAIYKRCLCSALGVRVSRFSRQFHTAEHPFDASQWTWILHRWCWAWIDSVLVICIGRIFAGDLY